MIFRFENPGHRERLQTLGLLHADEVEILAVILAQRMVDLNVLTDGLYIVKQELAHHLTNYSMIDGILEIAREAAENISNEETYQAAREWLLRVKGVVRTAAEMIGAASTLAESLYIMKRANLSLVLFDAQADHYLEEILVFVEKIGEQHARKGPAIIERVREIQQRHIGWDE
ncbi:MAG: hypothetical protein BroJett018_25980 [Chloroflexota bacterium]|nr:MAG: hypothetical protein BroJett018_25980 [Chloroflexota bacterium]